VLARVEEHMKRTVWSRILVIVGLLGMLIGALDPLEGSLIVLPGIGVAALGAFFSRSRYRLRLYTAFIMAAVGVGALFALSAYGGFGGTTGRSMWWGLLVLPYPLGWIVGLIGGILVLVQSFRHPSPTQAA
jgi:hypothetical protein